ncbi:MAG: DUF4440 domain-containing protein [Proteobacteria bacterium]|nr:DUF4440 domain-containing protein [Pseudomonadota bacterium]
MHIKNTLITVALFGFLAVGACAEPAGVDYMAEIKAVNAEFEAYYNAGDAAGVGTLYTEDAMLLPPGGPAVSGNEAMVAFWRELMASGLAGIELIDDEVFGMGNTATARGHFVGFDADGNEIGTGKYMVVWKKDGGAWKLHRDIWNNDQ